ncbi:hypothetical protein BSM4216_0334 [Bacillus smithii]|nr:hypothetical protein BSM4216_0334 [Bacillus smithii]
MGREGSYGVAWDYWKSFISYLCWHTAPSDCRKKNYFTNDVAGNDNRLETFISGKAMVVIQNGQIQTDALRKLRLTVDQLELRLRQQGIANFSDIKTATIEPSGQLGYELTEDAKPLTVGEFKKLMQAYIKNEESKESSQINIFDEITEKKSTPDSLK